MPEAGTKQAEWRMLTPTASGTPYECTGCGRVETVSIYSSGYRDEPDPCPECSQDTDGDRDA